MRLTFGKYRNWLIEDVPLGYLCWLIENGVLREPTRKAVAQEIAERLGLDRAYRPPAEEPRRTSGPSIPQHLKRWVIEIIEAGFRAAARKHHPDVGGSDESMRMLIESRDVLSTMFGGRA